MLSLRIDGKKLRRLREGCGLSVVALAEAAGCTKWAIYNIERGRNQPSPRVYAALRDRLEAADEDLAAEGDR
ncbi:helix-turn-helix transcriptional regulator [Streptomyces sp. NPDC058084]|uniref:helix-turn-helix transcriptional regulator n=1 Tax=Streptomyces sp. NPDC058084 TaxID=3346333 RepID=UPI0036E3962F